jgi:signal transduction histidine kinase
MRDHDEEMLHLRAECPLAPALAARMRSARESLVERWLERIAARVALDPMKIFPSDDLIDHIPLLINGIAAYVEDPAEEVTAEMPVVAKALELGSLRHSQGFDLHQVLREYEVLGGILHFFIESVIDSIDEPCSRRELVSCIHRLFRAVSLIQQATANEYMRLEQERVSQREQRLRGFNRALSHEIRNRIGSVRNAVAMLNEDFILTDERMRAKFSDIARNNTSEIVSIVDNLVELSRADGDSRRNRHVLLGDTAAEVKRRLRDYAAARRVEVRLGDMPNVEIPAAHIELALSNYVSNAIKYHDPEKMERWVEIRGRTDGDQLIVEVLDNGIGIAPENRDGLFQRFFRAGEGDDSVEGTGLGLSIVKEAVEGLGGRAWAEFPPDGPTKFVFAVPCRRTADRGSRRPEGT